MSPAKADVCICVPLTGLTRAPLQKEKHTLQRIETEGEITVFANRVTIYLGEKESGSDDCLLDGV